MIILAFDSTAKVASVAVLDGERVLGVTNIDNGLTQSELLLPMAEDLLKSLKLGFADVELLACSVGPGSFTGVRIGAALVKGLAFGRGIPCAAVSTLEALAYNLMPAKGRIVAVMDARRAQVYSATFTSDGEALSRLTEDRAVSIAELCDEIAKESEPVYLVGDGYDAVCRELLARGIEFPETPYALRYENAASVARVAYLDMQSGRTVSDLEIQPTYLRMPQAERERLEREKTNK